MLKHTLLGVYTMTIDSDPVPSNTFIDIDIPVPNGALHRGTGFHSTDNPTTTLPECSPVDRALMPLNNILFRGGPNEFKEFLIRSLDLLEISAHDKVAHRLDIARWVWRNAEWKEPNPLDVIAHITPTEIATLFEKYLQ